MHQKRSAAKQYAAYAVAAGAAIAAQPATAGVILTDPADVIVTNPTAMNIDLNGDTVVDYVLSVDAGFAIGNFANVRLVSNGTNQVAVNGGGVLGLITGVIDGSLTYGTFENLIGVSAKTNPPVGDWPNNVVDPRYAAVRFDISGSTHYGWIRIGAAVDLATPASQAILYDFAYENVADTAITIPGTAVPEPSSLALFALGAAGVAALKRRRG